MNILILDDDYLDLEGMKMLLDWKREGFDHVYTAANVSDARKIIAENPVNIGLLDIEMPGESGIDFAKWLEENHYKMQIIFITSHALFDYAAAAVRLHARDYLLKPVSADQLRSSLRSAVNWLQRDPDKTQPGSEEPQSLVQSVCAYIHDHIHEKITREELASYVYLHPDYLSHLFHEETGQTISAYILKEKIQAAEHMLIYTDKSVSEISTDFDFASTSYFGNVFRRVTGKTPKQYREEHRR